MQVGTPEVSAEQATTPAFKPGDKVTCVSTQHLFTRTDAPNF